MHLGFHKVLALKPMVHAHKALCFRICLNCTATLRPGGAVQCNVVQRGFYSPGSL